MLRSAIDLSEEDDSPLVKKHVSRCRSLAASRISDDGNLNNGSSNILNLKSCLKSSYQEDIQTQFLHRPRASRRWAGMPQADDDDDDDGLDQSPAAPVRNGNNNNNNSNNGESDDRDRDDKSDEDLAEIVIKKGRVTFSRPGSTAVGESADFGAWSSNSVGSGRDSVQSTSYCPTLGTLRGSTSRESRELTTTNGTNTTTNTTSNNNINSSQNGSNNSYTNMNLHGINDNNNNNNKFNTNMRCSSAGVEGTNNLIYKQNIPRSHSSAGVQRLSDWAETVIFEEKLRSSYQNS